MIKITSSLFQKIHVCIVNNSTNIKIYPYEQQVEMSKSMLSEIFEEVKCPMLFYHFDCCKVMTDIHVYKDIQPIL